MGICISKNNKHTTRKKKQSKLFNTNQKTKTKKNILSRAQIYARAAQRFKSSRMSKWMQHFSSPESNKEDKLSPQWFDQASQREHGKKQLKFKEGLHLNKFQARRGELSSHECKALGEQNKKDLIIKASENHKRIIQSSNKTPIIFQSSRKQKNPKPLFIRKQIIIGHNKLCHIPNTKAQDELKSNFSESKSDKKNQNYFDHKVDDESQAIISQNKRLSTSVWIQEEHSFEFNHDISLDISVFEPDQSKNSVVKISSNPEELTTLNNRLDSNSKLESTNSCSELAEYSYRKKIKHSISPNKIGVLPLQVGCQNEFKSMKEIKLPSNRV